MGNKFSNGIKRIHFVGIKGVGMAPLAIIAKQAGFKVSGSDVSETFITDEELKKSDISPSIGFSEDHVKDVDLVIYTSAHGGLDNLEVKRAQEKGIPLLNQGKALGVFQKGDIFGKKYRGISIAGSHGKTTTTAIIATILAENKLDPSFVIGSGSVPSLGGPGHFGKGEYFVSEADEYFADTLSDRTAKFLYQSPQIIVVTNIDFDHPDIYASIDEIRSVFVEFANSLPDGGVLIACADGDENRKFLNLVNARKLTYGFLPNCDYVLQRVSYSSEKMFFWVKSHNALLGQFSMEIFGEQNGLNALAGIVVGLEIGLSVDQIKKGLSKFRGTKRRSELIGNLAGGGIIYDDYAHHPEEIRKTLFAFRKSFPKYKIIPIFQPHMYSRTKKLFNQFASAFSDADEVIVTEIFPSFREVVDPNFSSRLLSEEIKKYGKSAAYFATLYDVVKYLTSRDYGKNTLVITMGAGDVYKIGKELIKS